jgi:hypothetical protein
VRLEFLQDLAHRRNDIPDHLPIVRGQGLDVGFQADEGGIIVLRKPFVPPPLQTFLDGFGPVSDRRQPLDQSHLFVRREIDQEGGEVRRVPPCRLGRIQHPRDAEDHVLDEEVLDQPEGVCTVAVEQIDRLGSREEPLVQPPFRPDDAVFLKESPKDPAHRRRH